MLLVYPGILRRLRLIAACVAALVLTTVVLYAYLPIRSAMNPPMDYASPHTWSSFWYVVLGQQFTGTFHNRPGLVESIKLITRITWEQFGVLLPLAAVGLVVGFIRRWALMIMLIAWFALTWYFDLGYDNADIGRYYLIPYMCVAVVARAGRGRDPRGSEAGRAATRARHAASGTRRVRLIIAVVLIVPAVASVPGRFHGIDESGDYGSRAWLTSLVERTAAGLGHRQLVELLDAAVVRASTSRAGGRT